jgi:MoaA/NifB/PqqE/SkfB family radical SAM enzyme
MIKGIKVNTLKDENEQDFIEYVERNKTTVENIMMLGGEPLLQKQNVNLLDVIPNSSVYILTNLAVPLENNPLSHKLILYKNVHYAVSFETVGTRFEYVRHGADWSVFNNNLEYLKNNVENFTVDIHALYSPYSAFNLVEFYEYILEKKLFKSVFWSLLTSSGENSSVFDTLLIPSLRLLAIKEIEKCEVLFPGEIGIDALTDIKNLLIYRKPGDGNTPRMLQELGSVESKLNKQPGKKFQDLWPDVYKELT